MNGPGVPAAANTSDRLYGRIDRLFLLFLILEFAAWALFPGLPLVVALASLKTQLRFSKWRLSVLWVVAAMATLIVIAPFIIGWLGLSTFSESTITPTAPAG